MGHCNTIFPHTLNDSETSIFKTGTGGLLPGKSSQRWLAKGKAKLRNAKVHVQLARPENYRLSGENGGYVLDRQDFQPLDKFLLRAAYLFISVP